MIQTSAPVLTCTEILDGIFVLAFRSQVIAQNASPGQFVNIRCSGGCTPMLRRPFSISRVDGDVIELVFNIVGQGTRLLSEKRAGEFLDVLGPLGHPFAVRGTYQTAILVGGGLGVAPFPFLTAALLKERKTVQTIVGARSASQLIEKNLTNVQSATDDGTRGFHGNVVDLLASIVERDRPTSAKIFGCGPTRMMGALSKFAKNAGIECELSLEGDMGCGVGLCQGCPVERTDGIKKYSLVCVEGPTFNSNDIIIP